MHIVHANMEYPKEPPARFIRLEEECIGGTNLLLKMQTCMMKQDNCIRDKSIRKTWSEATLVHRRAKLADTKGNGNFWSFATRCLSLEEEDGEGDRESSLDMHAIISLPIFHRSLPVEYHWRLFKRVRHWTNEKQIKNILRCNWFWWKIYYCFRKGTTQCAARVGR